MERRLPRHILNVAEAETVLAQADLATPIGIRDRAIMETLYSTGMRRMELIGLHLTDIDAERGTVMIRLVRRPEQPHWPRRCQPNARHPRGHAEQSGELGLPPGEHQFLPLSAPEPSQAV